MGKKTAAKKKAVKKAKAKPTADSVAKDLDGLGAVTLSGRVEKTKKRFFEIYLPDVNEYVDGEIVEDSDGTTRVNMKLENLTAELAKQVIRALTEEEQPA